MAAKPRQEGRKKMYTLIDAHGEKLGIYETKREALYYKKKNPKSKVLAKYEVDDIKKSYLTPRTKIMAESPKDAMLKYIEQEELDIKVEVDLTNRGRFVVWGNRT